MFAHHHQSTNLLANHHSLNPNPTTHPPSPLACSCHPAQPEHHVCPQPPKHQSPSQPPPSKPQFHHPPSPLSCGCHPAQPNTMFAHHHQNTNLLAKHHRQHPNPIIHPRHSPAASTQRNTNTTLAHHRRNPNHTLQQLYHHLLLHPPNIPPTHLRLPQHIPTHSPPLSRCRVCLRLTRRASQSHVFNRLIVIELEQ